MCRVHWYALRKLVRDAVWREYRRGQEVTKTPTARYMAVTEWAKGELAFKAHDEAAAAVTASYLGAALRWRGVAIARGQGDPLEDILASIPGDALRELVHESSSDDQVA
jgi:hypothetical protein